MNCSRASSRLVKTGPRHSTGRSPLGRVQLQLHFVVVGQHRLGHRPVEFESASRSHRRRAAGCTGDPASSGAAAAAGACAGHRFRRVASCRGSRQLSRPSRRSARPPAFGASPRRSASCVRPAARDRKLPDRLLHHLFSSGLTSALIPFRDRAQSRASRYPSRRSRRRSLDAFADLLHEFAEEVLERRLERRAGA